MTQLREAVTVSPLSKNELRGMYGGAVCFFRGNAVLRKSSATWFSPDAEMIRVHKCKSHEKALTVNFAARSRRIWEIICRDDLAEERRSAGWEHI